MAAFQNLIFVISLAHAGGKSAPIVDAASCQDKLDYTCGAEVTKEVIKKKATAEGSKETSLDNGLPFDLKKSNRRTNKIPTH